MKPTTTQTPTLEQPLPPQILTILGAGGVAFSAWLKRIGRDRMTGYRWRKLGCITTVNIFGQEYLTAEEEARFWARAKSGEFAKDPTIPTRPE